MQLGFIGLGNMGLGMARNLLRAGHQLIVFNRTRAKAEELEPEGARVAGTPGEAAHADIVFSMLADDAAVEEVVFGRTGILASAAKNVVHVSMSTISPKLVRHIAEAHGNEGQGFLSAPVFGRPEAAAAAKLTIVAAGPVDTFERCRPLLEVMGQKVFNLGSEPGKANVVKVCGNFMIASMLETLSEAFAVMRKAEIDPKLFLEIANGNLFRSPVYENYGAAILAANFRAPGFKLKLGLKDVKLALAAAEEVAVPMPLASLLRDQFLSGVARGDGDLDWSALSKIAAENAGLK